MPRGRVLALCTDHYEITMVAGALRSGVADRRAVFEVFTRSLPEGRAYGVVAGMDRVMDAVEEFRFESAVVDHLVEAGVAVDADTADWLRGYRFGGDVVGYPDGELFFPYSPVLTMEGGFAECVVLETIVLSILNHDCAVASAAARMRDATGESRMLLEGGSRRTDPDAAVAAARAAHIGGFDATSNLEAGRRWTVPTGGTTAHAFMLAHDDERAAFAVQRDTLGSGSTYLVDTFDVERAICHAVDVAGTNIGAVRIDSGDLLESSVQARALLDELGAESCRIVASGDLDEFQIDELEAADAPIDAYLVGTNLVTGSGHPTASMVYKLVAIGTDNSAAGDDTVTTYNGATGDDTGSEADPGGQLREVGKFSPGKATIGGRKHVFRSVDTDGFWEEEILVRAGDPLLSGDLSRRRGSGAHEPQMVMIEGGWKVYADDVAEARHRCAQQRSGLRPQDRAVYPLNAPAIRTRWQDWDDI